MWSRRILVVVMLMAFLLPSSAIAYTSGPVPWVAEDVEKDAHEAAEAQQAEERAAAERVAAATHEREAAEAAERAAYEASAKKTIEREKREAAEREATKASCVVPVLKGRSLPEARQALTRAHCRVGAVERPGKSVRTTVVVSQLRAPGTKLPPGARVGLRVGPKR
jgi:hypothetical protein